MAVAALLALGACASPQTPAPPTCSAPLKPAVEVDLYFGRERASGEVSEAEWAAFLNEEVTPRFPDGLSVLDVHGQYRTPAGAIERERTKLLVVVVFDSPAHAPKVQAVVDAYRRRYGQHSVFRVEHPVCAGA
jgi:hypothetical protein